ncbi:MSCRAMM family adhesin SdrC [Nocardioides KLBMP 9356]|uniref:MSCRAMM family adhesin SdrC n=1 Tax=Nocardioides potassii TaxID=2911371 RepID=A0ABS9H984_9ACTN|nr:MSCRAMM family adhesin SdrC [Nocardioides potassii]MCF6377034.1 MSCRAMM family adhesin SdrC [Nocardioides potassii]
MSRDIRRWTARFAILVCGLVASGLSVAAPAALLPAAQAATCTTSGGVSVVVDYRERGGATFTACAPDGGGKTASAIFASVGVQLTYATRQPGFVCRVNGVPTSDPCVNASPANAYWGLFWADGTKSSWTYSSYGVGGLTVPAGGSVGWSWQQDRSASGSVPPGIAPPVASAASATPTSAPTTAPSSPSATPSSGGGSQSSSPTSSPSPGAGGSGGGSTGGTGSGGGSNGGSGSTGGSGSSPSSSPSSTPGAPTESPLSSESPGDSRAKAGSEKDSGKRSGKGSDKASEKDSDDESVGDSGAGDGPTDDESPGDSTTSTAAEAGEPSADQPARIPAAVTWSVVGLLAIAIAGSAVVARRRRGV